MMSMGKHGFAVKSVQKKINGIMPENEVKSRFVLIAEKNLSKNQPIVAKNVTSIICIKRKESPAGEKLPG